MIQFISKVMGRWKVFFNDLLLKIRLWACMTTFEKEAAIMLHRIQEYGSSSAQTEALLMERKLESIIFQNKSAQEKLWDIHELVFDRKLDSSNMYDLVLFIMGVLLEKAMEEHNVDHIFKN